MLCHGSDCGRLPCGRPPDSHIRFRWLHTACPLSVTPAPEPGSSLGSCGSPGSGPRQASAVRPLLRRLRLDHESGLGPRLRGDDEKGRMPVQQGQQARRQAEMKCVHAVACGRRGRLDDGHGVLRLLSFGSRSTRQARHRSDPLSRAFACGRGRVSAPARFARLIARARQAQGAPRLSAESGSFRMARRGRLLRAVRDDAGWTGRLLRRVME